VIYTGLRQSPEAVAKIALEEDVDVIGLSSMAGSHMLFCQRLGELLQEHELTDKLWLIGGNIPKRDFADLKAIGLSGIFPTGTDFKEIVSFIRENVA
jgi:methylmalonyl-CoA mutase C-terminal domain/subunit